MAKKAQGVSIYKIADEAGVSVATVSRVLNRRTGVSEKTRRRIDGILREHRFTASYPQSRSARIAILVPDGYFSTYVREALGGIHDYSMTHDMSTNIIVQCCGKQESALEKIRDQQCVGAIALLATEPEYYQDIGQSELPLIFIDYSFRVKGAGIIGHDSYHGACEAMRHLLELGHQKIGFLCYSHRKTDHMLRFKAYENMLAQSGIEGREEWIVKGKPEDHYSRFQTVGITLMNQLLKQAPDVTAVMAMNDVIAMGAITAIHQHGLRIPADISVVGFDNLPEASCLYPSLTTVDHPIAKAGYLAMEAIDHALKSPGGWNDPPHEILPTSLVVRQSSGPIRKR